MNTELNDSVSPLKGNRVILATTLLYVLAGLIIRLLAVESIGSIVLSQCLILFCGLIGACLCRYDFKRDLRIRPVDGHDLLMVLFVMICCYPITALLNLISMQFVPNVVQAISGDLYAYGLGISLLLTAVFPAIGEELLIRGVVYRSYRKISPVAAMLVSALIFGLLHLNFNQMPYAIFLGIVMVVINEGADSMVMSMVLHFLFNGSSTLMNYMMRQFMSDEIMDEAMDTVAQAEATLFITYGMLAFIMGILLIVVVRSIYKHNHRTFAMVFGKDKKDECFESQEVLEGMAKRMRIVDWRFLLTIVILMICLIRSVL